VEIKTEFSYIFITNFYKLLSNIFLFL